MAFSKVDIITFAFSMLQQNSKNVFCTSYLLLTKQLCSLASVHNRAMTTLPNPSFQKGWRQSLKQSVNILDCKKTISCYRSLILHHTHPT
ncbi:hypothetical protein GDO78_016237 [Eleutherodactylus coqui]|uniref:Uncharacterized protein n=1 Tax=Eleutherodactylus coqui TaxID=57060 RepID=A0A8J6EBW5_ELECQ|nr:hypothetical protein GDO78_016237 [Eleutherodactylus coqui]